MSMRWSEEDLQRHLKRAPSSNPPPPTGRKPAPTPNPRAAARPGRMRGRSKGMNKTEAAYAQVLELRLHAGEIHWYAFERLKIRLADNTFLTPDFSVLMPDRTLEFHEVKGHWEEDARVKIKVAAEHNPFRFIAVSKRRKRDGGGWAIETFG